MKGASPNIHRLSSLRLPWCCCFAFLSNFKLLILSSRFRICHSLLFQHTKQTDKLLPQKQHFFVLVCFFFTLLLQQNGFLRWPVSEKGMREGRKRVIYGGESGARTVRHWSALGWSQSVVLLGSLFLFLLGPSAIPLMRSHKMLAEQAKQAEGLLAIISNPGLWCPQQCCLVGCAADELRCGSPNCFKPKTSFPSFSLPQYLPLSFPQWYF